MKNKIISYSLLLVVLISFFYLDMYDRERRAPTSFSDFSTVMENGKFYAYGTSSNQNNIPVKKSNNGQKYSYIGDAMPGEISWASEGGIWAPNVYKVDGTYIMYFSAINRISGKRDIGISISKKPRGPFKPLRSILVSNDELGGLIGPQHFIDSDGKKFILYKNDGNSIGIKSSLWIQALSSDGLKVIDNPTKLLDNTEVVNPKNIKVSKHPTTIEGPVIVKAPDGKYVLFFAGNNYATSDYFTGYAISDKLKGPYKYIGPLITTLSSSKTGEEIVGPGIGDLMEVSPNKYYISLNGWVNGIGKKAGGHRELFHRYVSFENGHTPKIFN